MSRSAAEIRDHVVRRLRLTDPRFAPAIIRQATCLAYAIYFEARGEGRLGQIAIAAVVLNRLASARYPATICAVILDEGQFPWVKGDLSIEDERAFLLARSVALHMMAGVFTDPTGGANHFYAPALVDPPAWAQSEFYTATIGRHTFFKLP